MKFQMNFAETSSELQDHPIKNLVRTQLKLRMIFTETSSERY